jgi:hypothetical protein
MNLQTQLAGEPQARGEKIIQNIIVKMLKDKVKKINDKMKINSQMVLRGKAMYIQKHYIKEHNF